MTYLYSDIVLQLTLCDTSPEFQQFCHLKCTPIHTQYSGFRNTNCYWLRVMYWLN